MISLVPVGPLLYHNLLSTLLFLTPSHCLNKSWIPFALRVPHRCRCCQTASRFSGEKVNSGIFVYNSRKQFVFGKPSVVHKRQKRVYWHFYIQSGISLITFHDKMVYIWYGTVFVLANQVSCHWRLHRASPEDSRGLVVTIFDIGFHMRFELFLGHCRLPRHCHLVS